MKSAVKKSTFQLALWTGLWVITTALTVFGDKFLWDGKDLWTLLAVILNLLVGLGMILANRNLFNRLDELQRKIQLESMGLTLGLSVVVGIAYAHLDATNLIPFDAEIAFLVMFIGITYLLTTVFNSYRYR